MLDVFVQGRLEYTSFSLSPRTGSVDMSVDAQVAIHAVLPTSSFPGFMASWGSVPTSSAWRCVGQEPTGRWFSPDYDDSTWPRADEVAKNGDPSARQVDDILQSAWWIWTTPSRSGSRDAEVWCRAPTVPCLNECVVTEWLEMSSYTKYAAYLNRYPSTPQLGRDEWAGLCSVACGATGVQQIFRFIISEPSLMAPPCPDVVRFQPCNEGPCSSSCAVTGWYEFARYQDYLLAYDTVGALNPVLPEDEVLLGCSDNGVSVRYRFVTRFPDEGSGVCPALQQSRPCINPAPNGGARLLGGSGGGASGGVSGMVGGSVGSENGRGAETAPATSSENGDASSPGSNETGLASGTVVLIAVLAPIAVLLVIALAYVAYTRQGDSSVPATSLSPAPGSSPA